MMSLKEEQDMFQKARVFRSEQNITGIFLPIKMSKGLTRVSSSNPSVPSRRSEEITSALKKQALQLKMKVTQVMDSNRIFPVTFGCSDPVVESRTTKIPTRAAVKRPQ